MKDALSSNLVSYRGYWYRKVPQSESRIRVWEPDGTFICYTGAGEADARKVIDGDIELRMRTAQLDLFAEAA